MPSKVKASIDKWGRGLVHKIKILTFWGEYCGDRGSEAQARLKPTTVLNPRPKTHNPKPDMLNSARGGLMG